MIIVGKATQEPRNGPIDYVEILLPQVRRILAKEKSFVYAWSFNPDDDAIKALRGEQTNWLYLVGQPKLCPMRMHVRDFAHDRDPLYCPRAWKRYCAKVLWGIDHFDGGHGKAIHIWLLIDKIEHLDPPKNVKSLTPFFPKKYRRYGRNFFGFFRNE